MRIARPAALVATVLATLVATAGPAVAAPPANDTYPGRVTISAVPFSTTQNTSEATTDADDAELNATCGAPAMDASVWYEVTATQDGALVADVSGSDYSAGVFIATGSPGNFEILACAPGAAAWNTVAGQTYSVIVIDDQSDGAGNGGTMALTVDTVPPPPSITASVNPFGVHHRDGTATVSGTVTCDSTAEFAFMDVELNQRVGRGSVFGFSSIELTCDGTAQPFSVTVIPSNGKFAGGRTASVTFAVACGVFECGVDFQEHIIKLRGTA